MTGTVIAAILLATFIQPPRKLKRAREARMSGIAQYVPHQHRKKRVELSSRTARIGSWTEATAKIDRVLPMSGLSSPLWRRTKDGSLRPRFQPGADGDPAKEGSWGGPTRRAQRSRMRVTQLGWISAKYRLPAGSPKTPWAPLRDGRQRPNRRPSGPNALRLGT